MYTYIYLNDCLGCYYIYIQETQLSCQQETDDGDDDGDGDDDDDDYDDDDDDDDDNFIIINTFWQVNMQFY